MARKKKQPEFIAVQQLKLSQEETIQILGIIVKANEYLNNVIQKDAKISYRENNMIVTFKPIKPLQGKNINKDEIKDFNQGIEFIVSKHYGHFKNDEQSLKTMFSLMVQVPNATIRKFRSRTTKDIKTSKPYWKKENINELTNDFQTAMIELKDIFKGIQ